MRIHLPGPRRDTAVEVGFDCYECGDRMGDGAMAVDRLEMVGSHPVSIACNPDCAHRHELCGPYDLKDEPAEIRERAAMKREGKR